MVCPAQEKGLAAYFQSPELLTELDNIRLNHLDPQPFFAKAWKNLETLGIIPRIMLIFGPGKFFPRRDEMALSKQARNLFYSILDFGSGRFKNLGSFEVSGTSNGWSLMAHAPAKPTPTGRRTS